MAISNHSIRTVTIAISAIALLTTASSVACGGDWFPEVQIDPRISGVAQAEKASAKGDYAAAAGSVVRMMPHVETLDPKSDPLLSRAGRVLALAIARENGRLKLEQQVPRAFLSHWLGKTESDRAKNLAWSIHTLRRELSLHKDDPRLKRTWEKHSPK